MNFCGVRVPAARTPREDSMISYDTSPPSQADFVPPLRRFRCVSAYCPAMPVEAADEDAAAHVYRYYHELAPSTPVTVEPLDA